MGKCWKRGGACNLLCISLVRAFSMVWSIFQAVSGAQAHATLILPFPWASPVVYSPGFLKHFLDPLSAATHTFNTSYPYLRGKVFFSCCRNINRMKTRSCNLKLTSSNLSVVHLCRNVIYALSQSWLSRACSLQRTDAPPHLFYSSFFLEMVCCDTAQVNINFTQTDESHSGSFFHKLTRFWVGWEFLGVLVYLPSHPLCLSCLPKKHLHKPAQYQKDVAAQKPDSSAHKQEHSALVWQQWSLKGTIPAVQPTNKGKLSSRKLHRRGLEKPFAFGKTRE